MVEFLIKSPALLTFQREDSRESSLHNHDRNIRNQISTYDAHVSAYQDSELRRKDELLMSNVSLFISFSSQYLHQTRIPSSGPTINSQFLR